MLFRGGRGPRGKVGKAGKALAGAGWVAEG